jgi:hypothetical protein
MSKPPSEPFHAPVAREPRALADYLDITAKRLFLAFPEIFLAVK